MDAISRRIATIALVALPVLQAQLWSADRPALDEVYGEVARNESLVLYLDESSGSVAVWQRNSDRMWTSNPKDRAEDSIAQGIYKMALSAQLDITYLDSLRDRVEIANSYTGSVRKKATSVAVTSNGVRVEYTFPSLEILIPVEYVIGPDFLETSVVVSEIAEGERYELLTVGLLPFFGAGGLREDGFLFVPDGSGALINFNNGKTTYADYEAPIYGRNPTLSSFRVIEHSEEIHLPVFGVSSSNGGFLAVVTRGDALGTITAQVSRKKTSYNRVFCSFALRATDTYIIGDPTGLSSGRLSRDIKIHEKHLTPVEKCTIRYYLLENPAPSFVDMAHRYRRHLSEVAGWKRREDTLRPRLYAEVVAAVRKKEPVAGIPVNVLRTLTATDELEDMTAALREAGVDRAVVRYRNWTRASIDGKRLTAVKVPGRIGGKGGFENLVLSSREGGVDLYPAVDFLNLRKAGNGFVPLFDAAETISGAAARQARFNPSTQSRDRREKPWFLLAPVDIEPTVEKFLARYRPLEQPMLSVSSLANLVYSDFPSESGSRQDCLEAARASLGLLSAAGISLAGEGANGYVLPFLDHVASAPTGSSGFDVTDAAVPFYQVVLRGMVGFAGRPANLSSNPTWEFLRAIETGGSIAFAWVYRDPVVLKNTELEYLYSGYFSSWIETAGRWYREILRVSEIVGTGSITDHEMLEPGVFRSTFEGDAWVIVNYRNDPVRIGEITIPGLGYLAGRGDS